MPNPDLQRLVKYQQRATEAEMIVKVAYAAWFLSKMFQIYGPDIKACISPRRFRKVQAAIVNSAAFVMGSEAASTSQLQADIHYIDNLEVCHKKADLRGYWESGEYGANATIGCLAKYLKVIAHPDRANEFLRWCDDSLIDALNYQAEYYEGGSEAAGLEKTHQLIEDTQKQADSFFSMLFAVDTPIFHLYQDTVNTVIAERT